MKFTRGPWKISGNRIHGGNFPDGIAHIMDADAGEVREANTKLIASAPIMYLALEQIAIYYNDFEKYPLVPVAELRDLINDVLKKAKGE